MSPALLTPERVRELTAAFRPAVQPKPQRIPPQKVEHRERQSHYSHVTPVESGCMVQLWHSGMYICAIARAIVAASIRQNPDVRFLETLDAAKAA